MKGPNQRRLTGRWTGERVVGPPARSVRKAGRRPAYHPTSAASVTLAITDSTALSAIPTWSKLRRLRTRRWWGGRRPFADAGRDGRLGCSPQTV